MGFWDLFKRNTHTGENKSGIVAELCIDNQQYILQELHLKIIQDVDELGCPVNKPYGGFMSLTLQQAPDLLLTRWIVNNGVRHEGEINFYAYDNSIDSGSVYKILFKDAYCTLLERQSEENSADGFTKIKVYPHMLLIADDIIENNWEAK